MPTMKRAGNSAGNANNDHWARDHLLFVVEVDDRIVCYSYPLGGSQSWLHFEQYLRDHLKYEQIKVTYKDEDGDDINLSSEEEFQEVLKVSQRINTFLKLSVKRLETDAQHNGKPVIDDEGFPASVVATAYLPLAQKKPINSEVTSSTPPSSARDKCQVYDKTDVDAKIRLNEAESVEDDAMAPPEWFTKYMETFKGDVTAEAARKMMHRMQKFLMRERIAFQPQNQAAESTVVQAQKRSVSSSSVLSSAGMNKVIHTGVKCDNCEETIVGVRYKCGNCVKYDLCEICEGQPDVHDKYHVFVKILRPATYAGFKKSTGKMMPLLKHLLYDDSDKATDLRTDREKKLLKRLEKQTHKLEKYKEKHRQRCLEREGRAHSGEARNGHVPNGHTHNYAPHHQLQHHRQKHSFRSSSGSRNDASQEPWRPWSHGRVPGGIKHDRALAGKMDAVFINDECVPDGTKVAKGMKFNKSWRLQNTGMKPWTSETILKYVWGTSEGLRASVMEIAVPVLNPGEYGVITIEFTAPNSCGLYESHWCFYHRGMRFGHQIWCSVQVVDVVPAFAALGVDPRKNVPQASRKAELAEDQDSNVVADGAEVQEPENGEKERLDAKWKKMQHLRHSVDQWADHFQQVVDGTSALTLEKEAGGKMLRPHYGSITATPNNTPRDLTPPKSPEPGERETQENLMSELTVALEDKDNSFLSEESDFGGSLVSLSSTDSDLGYVVVPLPACFNLTVPAVAVHGAPNPDDLPPNKGSAEREENSSVTTATDSDEETTKVPVAKVFRAPDDLIDSDSEDDLSATTQGTIPAPVVQRTEAVAKKVEAESGEGVSHVFKASAEAARKVEAGSGDKITTESVKRSHKTEQPMTATSRPSTASDRMVPILPEPIISAAATVFNSARDILHTFTDASRPTAPPPVVPPAMPVSAPLRQLQDMGFCSRELNERVLAKHNGDVQQAVTELLSLTDNEWFNNRH